MAASITAISDAEGGCLRAFLSCARSRFHHSSSAYAARSLYSCANGGHMAAKHLRAAHAGGPRENLECFGEALADVLTNPALGHVIGTDAVAAVERMPIFRQLYPRGGRAGKGSWRRNTLKDSSAPDRHPSLKRRCRGPVVVSIACRPFGRSIYVEHRHGCRDLLSGRSTHRTA
jgi:hypothetical protein